MPIPKGYILHNDQVISIIINKKRFYATYPCTHSRKIYTSVIDIYHKRVACMIEASKRKALTYTSNKLHLYLASGFGDGFADHLMFFVGLILDNAAFITLAEFTLEVIDVVPWSVRAHTHTFHVNNHLNQNALNNTGKCITLVRAHASKE